MIHSLYLQRLIKNNADWSYEKTNPIKANIRSPTGKSTLSRNIYCRTGANLERCHWNRTFHYVIIGKMLELADYTLGVLI